MSHVAKLFTNGRSQAVRLPAAYTERELLFGLIRRPDATRLPIDLLIAAHAISAGATLVTNDSAFTQIPGLSVEDWTKA